MSLPPTSVMVDQLPAKVPHVPLLSVVSSRSTMLVVLSTPEAPSLPPFFVTATEGLV